MNIRKQRQQAILELIKAEPVSTQDELISKLLDKGFEVTQATISRDIKELQLVKKIGSNGKSVYTANETPLEKLSSKYNAIFTEALVSVDYALNTVVIKTHVGMANAACAALDASKNDGILGTIAGDDTIFVCCRDEEAAAALSKKIGEVLGE
ncbi:MAG: arginine repressor [Clostridia bacterium]|nr:arginine repressor [Clostridia bacterium]